MTQDPAKTEDVSERKVLAPGSLASRGASSAGTDGTPRSDLLGRYRIVEEIGVGGMARVHLARLDGPGGFQKWAAIKRIHPHLIADESFVQMFLDEARIAARISHPNVATVFELGRHGNTYWIAMEYLHGEPLREVMRRAGDVGGPLPPEIASRVIADAADGLHSAHELLGKDGEKLNLVHRDVTPHNLFVTYEGATKVVDFGIAKCSSRMSSTRAGTLKGKLAYMSPEQVHGEAIDRRTDIFALGVVLWELTTGRRLFRADSDLGTLAKVRECDIPKPSRLVQAYPLDLEDIVMKALAKKPQERFATARELSRALQSMLMRRGLFVASEEVAGYVQFIFRDRIRKREAHLRWAGNGSPRDLAASSTPSLHTYVSELQAGVVRARGIPRPAAGIPAIFQHRWAPMTGRHGSALQRTTAQARTQGFGEDAGDDADTLVTRPIWEERSPPPLAPSPARSNPSATPAAPRRVGRAGHSAPAHPPAPARPPGALSFRPAVPHAQRNPRHPSPDPTRRVVARSRPSSMPVWAAAAISGALALLPASGIFVAVSRALRPSAKTWTGVPAAPSFAPRAVPWTARASAETSPAAPASAHAAGLTEELDGCTVSSCRP